MDGWMGYRASITWAAPPSCPSDATGRKVSTHVKGLAIKHQHKGTDMKQGDTQPPLTEAAEWQPDRTTYPRLGPLGTKNGATTPTSAHNVVKQIIGRASEWDAMTPVREKPAQDEEWTSFLSRRTQSASMAAQPNGRFRSVPAHVDERDMWLAQCAERALCDWFSCESLRIKARGLDGRQRQQTADQRDLYIYLFFRHSTGL